ncbi:MAG: hypothetical protein HGN29_08005 [Asgard group archaeon]|nr:hypothetical protein [Asgard group archaeon]
MLIKRILIITEHGVPIFDYEEYSRGDEVLVSGLITAILRFVEEIEKEKLSRVLLEESQYLLKSKDSLIFIFQISDEMPNEYADYVSDCISENFYRNYKEHFEGFSGNVSVFHGFQEECRNILLQCGVEIADVLFEDPEGGKMQAWCMFSNENEPLVVMANAPNYNIDSFTIFQVLGKSLRKVVSSMNNCEKGMGHHITHQGNLIQTIIFPFVIIVMESKIKEFEVKRFRQFKTKSHKQILDMFTEAFNPDKIEIYNRSLVSPLTNENISGFHKILSDLFQAAEKGLEYLFTAPVHVQIFTTQEKATVVIKLVNRILFLDYDHHISTSDLLELTKRVFEKDIVVKDEIPEAVLEKS